LDVRQAMSGLLLNSNALDSTCDGISWGGAGYEHQPGRLDRLSVGGRRVGRFGREDDLTGHWVPSSASVELSAARAV